MSGCRPKPANQPACEGIGRWPERRKGNLGLLQEWALKVHLKIGQWPLAIGKYPEQMFQGLEPRIGLRARRRFLLPAQHRSDRRQALSQPLSQMVKGLQGKGQLEPLHRRLN
jgi:hypothetical protein